MEEVPKRRRSIKRKLGCCAVVLFPFVALVICLSVLTIAGYTKEWVCSASLEDSIVADELNCATEEVDSEDLDDEQTKDLEEVISTPIEDRITKIVEVSKPSVAGIGVKGDGFVEDKIVGTGFVVDSQGFIVTNQHVVSNRTANYFVKLEGIEGTIKVDKVYRDELNDIAVLKITTREDLEPLALGDSSKLRVGQTVIAIGNPLGELQGTVTSGIISGLNREVEIGSGGFFNSQVSKYEDVIQTDAAINPGNSGGPLFDIDGRVIGVNFATVGGADNLSFALPINRVKARIDELERFGEFRLPYVGIEYQTRVIFVENESMVAAQVKVIAKDSPAEKAGLAVGDYIVGFNGEDLSEKTLFEHIQESEIGDKVKFNILRGQERKEVEVEIGSRVSSQ